MGIQSSTRKYAAVFASWAYIDGVRDICSRILNRRRLGEFSDRHSPRAEGPDARREIPANLSGDMTLRSDPFLRAYHMEGQGWPTAEWAVNAPL